MGNFSVHGKSSDYSSIDLTGEVFPDNFERDYILEKKVKENIRQLAEIATLKNPAAIECVKAGCLIASSKIDLLDLPVYMFAQGLDPEIVEQHIQRMKERAIGKITGIAINKRAAGQVLYLKLRGDIENIEQMPRKIYGIEGLEKIQDVVSKYLNTQEKIKYTLDDLVEVYRNPKTPNAIDIQNRIDNNPEMITEEKIESLWNVISDIRDLIIDKKERKKEYIRREKIKRSEEAHAVINIPEDGLKPHTRAKIVRLTNEVTQEAKRLDQWEWKVASLNEIIESYEVELSKMEDDSKSVLHWLLMIFSIGIYALIYYGEKQRHEENIEIARKAIIEAEAEINQIENEIDGKKGEIEDLKESDASDSDSELPSIDGTFEAISNRSTDHTEE
ncbi:MAG: hypothetical protein S4CHLAM20_07820 [Chlamydiia bacterium]|nr:hypothetical protein [Chlamydiia bacterium]